MTVKRQELEHNTQVMLFNWARLASGYMPELKLMFAIPNGGSRGGNKVQRMVNGKKMKAEGVKKGVPDICLPVAKGKYHGLFIELKKEIGGSTSAEQKEWLEALKQQGYKAELCRGLDAARKVITNYLK